MWHLLVVTICSARNWISEDVKEDGHHSASDDLKEIEDLSTADIEDVKKIEDLTTLGSLSPTQKALLITLAPDGISSGVSKSV